MTDIATNNDDSGFDEIISGSGGPPAFVFAKIGDTASGVVIKKRKQQERDFESQELKFWPDGNPVMQGVITLRLDDGEETRLFFKPAMTNALKDALEAAGASRVEIGGRLAVKFSDEKPHERRGFHPQKLFTAKYEPPKAAAVSEADLF